MSKSRNVVTETIKLVAGCLAILALLAIADVASIKSIPVEKARAAAVEISDSWLEDNFKTIPKGLKTSLMGTGVWLGKFEPEHLKLETVEISPSGTGLATYSIIDHSKVGGEIEILVSLNQSALAGVDEPEVSGVVFKEITRIKDGKVVVENESVYSHDTLTKARARYYLTAVSSIMWHLLVAGIGFGMIGQLSRKVMGRKIGAGPTGVLSIALSIVLVLAASQAEASFIAGSVISMILFAIWWFVGKGGLVAHES